MDNCIIINNQKIELTPEQIEKIVAAHQASNIKLAEVQAGETFKLGEYEFVVLEQFADTADVILRGLLPDTVRFGKNNNYNGSNADEECQSFAQKLAGIIGWENILLHGVDLTSDDGLKDYGVIERRVSSITAQMYRRYVEVLDKYKPDEWWWLATPFSTERHNNTSWVKCVSPSGCVNYDSCDYFDFGVRPFCILKSTIFVSK